MKHLSRAALRSLLLVIFCCSLPQQLAATMRMPTIGWHSLSPHSSYRPVSWQATARFISARNVAAKPYQIAIALHDANQAFYNTVKATAHTSGSVNEQMSFASSYASSGGSVGTAMEVAFVIGLFAAIAAFYIESKRRQRTEQALRISRKRYQAQYMGIPVPTFTWQWQQDEFRLVDYNNAAITWTDGRIQSLMGKTVTELYQQNRPDIAEDIRTCYREKTNIHKCFWYNTVSEDSKHYVDVTYAYIPDDFVLVHTSDITDRKMAEENLQLAHRTLEHRVSQRTQELQQINVELTQEILRRQQAESDLRAERDTARYCINNVSAIIVGLDKNGNITLINQLACKLLERPEKEMIGENWFTIALPNDTRDETLNAFRLAMDETRNTIDYYENPIVSQSGRQYLIAWKNNILRNAEGHITGCLSVGEDITEKRKAEELLRARQMEMAHFARITSVGEMATALAHELNQPLTAINIYAGSCIQQLASNQEDPQRLRNALEQIAQQGQRAANIIQNLRQYLSKGKSERKLVDINELILQTSEIAFIDAKKSHIKVHFDLAPKLPLVYVDPVQIEQVIVNLLCNSFDALTKMRDNNRHIWVKSGNLNNYAIEVSVSDNGQGIKSTDMEKIFEPFYSQKPDGMGLGLAISRSIIEAHEGRLKAFNVPQGGATFTFTLPIEQTDHD